MILGVGIRHLKDYGCMLMMVLGVGITLMINASIRC